MAVVTGGVRGAVVRVAAVEVRADLGSAADMVAKGEVVRVMGWAAEGSGERAAEEAAAMVVKAGSAVTGSEVEEALEEGEQGVAGCIADKARDGTVSTRTDDSDAARHTCHLSSFKAQCFIAICACAWWQQHTAYPGGKGDGGGEGGGGGLGLGLGLGGGGLGLGGRGTGGGGDGGLGEGGSGGSGGDGVGGGGLQCSADRQGRG